MTPEPWELPAIEYGGKMGGEYLESINKYSLNELTPQEWQTFITTITLNYHAEHNRLKPCPF